MDGEFFRKMERDLNFSLRTGSGIRLDLKLQSPRRKADIGIFETGEEDKQISSIKQFHRFQILNIRLTEIPQSESLQKPFSPVSNFTEFGAKISLSLRHLKLLLILNGKVILQTEKFKHLNDNINGN